MKAQLLMNSILQYAMQGKLVKQNFNDESVSSLLERVGKEKEQLIKEKVIKRETTISPITDNELPFEIPSTWKWVRLADVASKIHYGYTASASDNGNAKLLRITDIQNSKVNWDTVPFCEINQSNLPSYTLESRDILIARTGGTIGKSYLMKDVKHTSVFASYLIRVKPLQNVNAEYLKLFLETPLYWKQLIEMSAGTGQPNVNGQNLKKLIIPLPPENEQKRILDYTKIAFEKINEYDSLEKETTILNVSFPTNMEKSILHFAIQGKLVLQDSNEEPASLLLERIAKEKEKLVKDKIIKLEKALSPIYDEDLSFEIPQSWEWVRLGDISRIVMGQSPPGNSVSNSKEDLEFHQGKTNFGKMFLKESELSTSKENKIALPGAVLLSVRAPVGTVNITNRKIGIGRGLCAIEPLSGIDTKFYYYFIHALENELIKKSTGTTFKAVTAEVVKNLLIPLPPIKEQQRIITKIEEMYSLTKKLKLSVIK